MRFIESDTDLQWLQEQLNVSDSLWIPILGSTKLHYVHNEVILIYFYFISTKTKAVMSVNHIDAHRMPLESVMGLSLINNIFIYGERRMPHSLSIDAYDTDVIYWLSKGITVNTKFEGYPKYLDMWYNNVRFENAIIPITIHIAQCDELAKMIIPALRKFKNTTAVQSYENLVIPSIRKLESAGIKVTDEFLKMTNIKANDNIVYTYYNIYTQTGRPSNTFGGMNYAALNKEDGTRDGIISRFDGGKLYEFDFDSFHLQLISDCIGYTFDESIHLHFAKIYFDKTDITDEEYDVAKQITFKQIFGGVDEEYKNVEFFKRVHQFSDNLWQQFRLSGYVETLLFNRKIEAKNLTALTRNKLFNYFIQALEFETGIVFMAELHEYLEPYKSKFILYTYDSFLFDIHPDEEKDVVGGIYSILNQKYPVRKTSGYSYGKMHE